MNLKQPHHYFKKYLDEVLPDPKKYLLNFCGYISFIKPSVLNLKNAYSLVVVQMVKVYFLRY
jgi:hypothetical protein